MQRRVVLLRLPGLALRGVLVPVARVPQGCHSRALGSSPVVISRSARLGAGLLRWALPVLGAGAELRHVLC